MFSPLGFAPIDITLAPRLLSNFGAALYAAPFAQSKTILVPFRLKFLGKMNKPVILKRGMCATLKEFMMSAEYLMSSGCEKVVLCERGIRTFSDHARNVLDIGIIPAIKKDSHLPIIVDPSHASGYNYSVVSHALAGLAAGADGMIVEVHDCPEEALSDGPQALLPKQFSDLVKYSKGIIEVLKK